MDWSWLGDLFHGLLKIFDPLKNIAHWKIWAELIKWYERFKKWRNWFRDHILGPLRREQQVLNSIKDQFVLPVIRLIDHVRQLASLIGIFNKKLADKLNYQFLKIEGYLLKPFNTATSRINSLGFALQSVLTPLGYLDRGALCNSIWRDAKLVKGILHNPLQAVTPTATLPPSPSINDRVSYMHQYLNNDSGPYATDVDTFLINFESMRAGG